MVDIMVLAVARIHALVFLNASTGRTRDIFAGFLRTASQ
jgi:hypothetical protein